MRLHVPNLDNLDPAGSLQEQLDLDSFDFLQFIEGLHDALGVDIPERDYPKIASLDGCAAYVERLLAAEHPTGQGSTDAP